MSHTQKEGNWGDGYNNLNSFTVIYIYIPLTSGLHFTSIFCFSTVTITFGIWFWGVSSRYLSKLWYVCEHKSWYHYVTLIFGVQITTNVVGIIDNVTQWPDNARNVNASRSVFMCMVSCHIDKGTWHLYNLSPSFRIIDAFEDTVTVILQDTTFNTTLVVQNDNVALRAERVRLQWALLTQASIY